MFWSGKIVHEIYGNILWYLFLYYFYFCVFFPSSCWLFFLLLLLSYKKIMTKVIFAWTLPAQNYQMAKFIQAMYRFIFVHK